jgi:glycosyltransferase involved in cell wall biosynthesis
MKVLRVYHSARDRNHRARERALAAAGVELTLVVPANWPDAGVDAVSADEPFSTVELRVDRVGDVNRHTYADNDRIHELLRGVDPDVIDIHEEPFSRATHQWLSATPPRKPVLVYTAQNIDKRFPPPFTTYERRCYQRASAIYPCSKQAAAVVRGKGFRGPIEVLPLGYDATVFEPGRQSSEADELVLAFVGRLVPEKGATDAVRLCAAINAIRPARLEVVGDGPQVDEVRALSEHLGVSERVALRSWQSPIALAAIYRESHVVLVPSRRTATWTEQFGRVIVEAQASGALVVGYASGSIPEVAGDAALLSSEGDLSTLASHVNRVFTDRTLYEDLRGRGIANSSARTWERVGERQAQLYQQVVGTRSPRKTLPRSPRRRRAIARQEFGPTAPSAAGMRPFADPVLRSGSSVSSWLAAVVDAGAELLARVERTR